MGFLQYPFKQICLYDANKKRNIISILFKNPFDVFIRHYVKIYGYIKIKLGAKAGTLDAEEKIPYDFQFHKAKRREKSQRRHERKRLCLFKPSA